MRYCKRCAMPSTRPGMKFDEEGVCFPCKAEEKKDKTDWNARNEELKKLCDKHRGINGNSYDCVIAVSGGKDSHYQVYVMKELMKMNPLLVTVEDNFPMTIAGEHNLKNISEAFGCNIISLKPNIKVQKIIMRKTFEKYGKPTWFIDRLIYTYPIHMAVKFKIPLLVYGENISYEYGGAQTEETYSAMDQLENDVAADIPYDELIDDIVSIKDLSLLESPSKEEIEEINLEPIYLSYFKRWNDFQNYNIAKKYGFWDLTHEWHREHHIEHFWQVDTRGYLVHAWMKYPKFGHATATDAASRFIKYGIMTRKEGIELIKKRDHKLDQLAVRDFCNVLSYNAKEFYDIVDGFYNQEIFEKNKIGEWVLKNPIWKQSN